MMIDMNIYRKTHFELFSGTPLKLGQIHWIILRSANEMDNNRYPRQQTKGEVYTPLSKIPRSEFSKEVGSDELHWWIFKKENQIVELQERTEQVLEHAQKLKVASRKLSLSPPNQYQKLISVFKNFCVHHEDEIEALNQYVIWLFKKNKYAPSILFTYRVWGSTRRSDRWLKINANTIKEEIPKNLELATELVFGLKNKWNYTLYSVYAEVGQEIGDSYADISYEDMPTIEPSISMDRVFTQTSHEALQEFSTYFEFLRNSLRNILLDIKKRDEQQDLMKSEMFWQIFIEKAMNDTKAEPQLWDFKKTLSIWHIKNSSEKEKHKLEFCETVASLANAKGGVLLVGISDQIPRKVVGIGNNLSKVETRLKNTRTVIANYIKYDRDIIYFKQVSMVDDSGNGQICLVIVIAQSERVVAVDDQTGRFSYPIRRVTGLDRIDRAKLAMQKLHIKSDNNDFMEELFQYTYSG